MAERFIPEHRRTQFKAKGQFKPDELRRRREEQQVEIRKAKREENLAKRRGITASDGTQTSAPGASLGAAPDSDDEDAGTIESQVCSSRLSIGSVQRWFYSAPVLYWCICGMNWPRCCR
jgi:importin subunit alpha-1